MTANAAARVSRVILLFRAILPQACDSNAYRRAGVSRLERRTRVQVLRNPAGAKPSNGARRPALRCRRMPMW
ncbi:hypothetical protein CR51_15370 [Caballeronia megalochromosomata]|nr:hypothetical protein CR51_15370 [Caballeronia megalochromosomata]